MTTAQEMFRFVNVRRPNRAILSGIANRLILDNRPTTRSSLLVQLFGPGPYEAKLAIADRYAKSPAFLADDDPSILVMERSIAFFRDNIEPGIVLADFLAELRSAFPVLARLLEAVPPRQLLEQTNAQLASEWDSLYALTILGCDRYVSTNYLVDGLRQYHVLRLLWSASKLQQTTWTGLAFDDYDTLIDLKAAASAGDDADRTVGRGAPTDPTSLQVMAPSPERLASASEAFRVPLSVGAMKPPVVGDLLLVEQTLRGYELNEVSAIENIMRGERRERTTRNLSRTSQTTTIESSSEQEESSTSKTDERFSLAAQAQQTAQQSFGVDAGVSVSGKFGPVQVSASVNASFDTAQSSSESTSQEYAKTVTEEASKRIKSSIKETSSVTIFTEAQDTTLRGFNNESGATHINGLYRWVDKIYSAQLVNYGRRLMFSPTVPEPAAWYRSLIQQDEAEALGALVEPLHPSRIDLDGTTPLPESNTSGGFLSYQDLSVDNYAKLAARYDVSVQPPPPEHLTGSTTIVYPVGTPATELKEHDHPNDLTYVTTDNTLTLDPSYRLTQIGVYAPANGNPAFSWFVEVLKIGMDKDESNHILIQVADKSFYISATGHGADPPTIVENLNTMQDVDATSSPFGDSIQSTLPITITANFEGVLTFTVIYQAYRRDEAYDAWKSSTFSAILKGYTTKKQAYDLALTLAQSVAKSGTDAKTFQLRDDQYRSIELTELKRGCIDLFTEGTATGYTSISVAGDGTPEIVYDPAVGAQMKRWRSPLANGSVAEFFELAFDWDNTTYRFHPYYWAGSRRWSDLARATSADPVFELFLRAGSASVIVPVQPGFERPVLFFLKTGRIWGGGYLSLFTEPDMLEVYAEVELNRQLDPPLAVGDPWEVRLPTPLVMLQEGETLPEFPPEEQVEPTPPLEGLRPDASVPF